MEECSSVHLGARRLMGADTLMTGDMALLECCASTSQPMLDEVCMKVRMEGAPSPRKCQGRSSIGHVSLRWSEHLSPEVTSVSSSFPTTTPRGDEEDLADRCLFDGLTRGPFD